MSLPSPLLSAPALLPDQLSFAGVVIGGSPRVPFGIKKLEGLDKPDVRSGNMDRPRTRGQFVGLNLLKQRIITVTLDIGPVAVGTGTNLVPDPSFEEDAPGATPAAWAASGTFGALAIAAGSTLTVTAAQAEVGSQSCQVVTTAVTGEGLGITLAAPSGGFVAGTTYTFQVWMKGNAGGELVALQMGITGDHGSIVNTTLTSGWAQYSCSWTPAGNQTTGSVGIRTRAASVYTFFVDAAMAAAGSGVSTYVDGDKLGFQWQGTAGNSATIPTGTYGTYGSTLVSALNALRNACATEGTTETPLWIQIPGQPLVACMARVLKKNIPYDVAADVGGLVENATIQFEAVDPYLYSAPTLNPTISLPTPGGGFSFPLTFNLSFGGGTLPNQYTAVNGGDVPCWPTLVITGPCLNPTVQNQSIAGNPFLTFGIQLNAGDQLVVDCDMQSVVYFPAGSSVGAPYPQLLQAGSTFFALPPGSSTIAFNSQDTGSVAGTLNVWNASAYDGVT